MATVALLMGLLVLNGTAYGESRVEYSIEIFDDGSATWVVSQTGVEIQVSPETLNEFEDRVKALVDNARVQTNRSMTSKMVSLTLTPSGVYLVAEYMFNWTFFSVPDNERIMIGDVFQVVDVFSSLLGDGEVHIKYPLEYSPETVFPDPYEQRTNDQMLIWLGTLNFRDNQTNIVLRRESDVELVDFFWQNWLLILGVFAVSGGALSSFYVLRRYKRSQDESKKEPQLPIFPGKESDEDKIVRIIKSSGGSTYQSAIVEACRFSKAKTSLLLASLERKGTITRYKKGRDKIVTLVGQGEPQE